MTSTNTAGWAQLRQQTRTAESQTETLFHTYSQFSAPSSITAKPSDDETSTLTKIDEQLAKRESLIAHLSNLLETESTLTASALKQNNLSRHKEVLEEHRRELSRLQRNITVARDKHNLLSTVRSDIDEYRSSNPAQAEADYMLNERRHIENSSRLADGVLSQAYSVNESFNTQRETLASVNRRIVAAASTLPGMNTLMNRISSKKRRDAIILASFIAFCFLMLLYFR